MKKKLEITFSDFFLETSETHIDQVAKMFSPQTLKKNCVRQAGTP